MTQVTEWSDFRRNEHILKENSAPNGYNSKKKLTITEGMIP
jgi:hypothetical protein